jgi:hypothetical protein
MRFASLGAFLAIHHMNHGLVRRSSKHAATSKIQAMLSTRDYVQPLILSFDPEAAKDDMKGKMD